MSAQSVTRIAGSGTTVYQCCTKSLSVQDCASFVSSSGNSNRTTTRSSLHARSPSMSTRARTKAQSRAKGTTERAIHRTTRKTRSGITENIPRENFSVRFQKMKTASNYSHYRFILIRKQSNLHHAFL